MVIRLVIRSSFSPSNLAGRCNRCVNFLRHSTGPFDECKRKLRRGGEKLAVETRFFLAIAKTGP